MLTQSFSRYIVFLLIFLPAILALILLSGNQEAAASNHIIYVNAGAGGLNDGSSWADAFTDLQAALAAATIGDEIWVAAGLYKPTDDPADREASFYLKSGVALFGGFTGTETERDERDWQLNLTILSGDIDDNDLTDPAGVVTNTAHITGTNSYHVVVGFNVGETAVLDGFTITAGQADGLFPYGTGGGMNNDNSHPSLTNVTFVGNFANFGGGMANVFGSSPALTDVTFFNNNSAQGGGMGNGDSNPSLTNVTFIGNDSGFGGGMGNVNSNPNLTNVTFSGNSADHSEGGYGGGMSNVESSPSLTNVAFSDNSASFVGGGMFSHASSPTLTDVTFSNNSSDGFGGGMFNEENSSPTLIAVTFSGNSADLAGGGMVNWESDAIVTNVVFSDNSAGGLGGGMYNFYSQPTVTDVSFDGNTTVDDGAGGGMFNYVSQPTLIGVSFSDNSANYSGGGMDNWNSSPDLTDVSFSGNAANFGGGMANSTFHESSNGGPGSNPTLTNVTFHNNIADFGGGMANADSNPILTNVVFGSNIAIYGGGLANGIYDGSYFSTGSSPTLSNVTFSGNIGSFGGGMYNEDDSAPLIQNSIFWHNQDLSGLGTPDASIYNDSSAPAIRYSLVQGCNPNGSWVSNCGTDGGNNLADADPLFVETPDPADAPTSDGNLRLQAGSPAIDAGNNEYVAGIATDLDGNPRIMGTAVDLGPYEFNSCTAVGAVCVDQAATGANDGSSWADAFTDLQDALAAAVPGMEIWVAAGIYKPTDDPTDREASFYLQDGVAIYGGFATWETDRDQRDWENNLTILSGDIDDNDLTDPAGVVTNTAHITGTNSYHVVVGFDVDETAVLDGFTITAGQANGLYPHENGGGMLNEYGSPSLSNLIFSGNTAAVFGGGMVSALSNPSLTNVIFSNNSASSSDYGYGGGLANLDSSPSLTNVTFSGNQASVDGGGLSNSESNPSLTNVTFSGNIAGNRGGGMVNWESNPILTTVIFDDNSANYVGGGGMANSYSSPILIDVSFIGNSAEYLGGGMDNDNSHPYLTNVTFFNNSARAGGGMTNSESNPTLINVVFKSNSVHHEEIIEGGNGGGMSNDRSNPTLTNVLFSGNSADFQGGGIFNWDSNPTLTNVTFSGNLASYGGGMYNEDNSNPLIQNSIFWHNADGTPAASIYNDNGAPTIRYSLVQGCNPGGVWDNDCGTDDGHNLPDADPLFIETPDPATAPTMAGNLRLQPGSPAIDAGNNEYVAGVATDLDGNPRVMGTAVDLGPYELDACATNSILCVDQAATGANDGSSWANAFNDLQDALAAAVPGNEIWVAAGVYKPTDDPTDREVSFYLIDGVAVYGGFAGWETIRDQRDWESNLTVLSGDIDNNDITDPAGVVTDTANIMGANSYHVVVGSGVTETAVLDGFAITAGQANDAFPNIGGGGMFNIAGSPSLANLTFSGNFGAYGGGIFNYDNSSPSLTNVTFISNLALLGGGIANYDNSSPTLTNLTFNENNADAGGGIYNYNSNPMLANITFNNNNAEGGGGLYNDGSSPTLTYISFNGNSGSGMINTNSSSPTLLNVDFSENSTGIYGGGMKNTAESNPILTNVTFSSNSAYMGGGGMFNENSTPHLTNVVFSGNISDFDGGGIENIESSPTLTNVVFSGNSASAGGGMANWINSNPTIQNTVFWQNQDNSGVGTTTASVYNNNSIPIIRYSLVQGCNPGGAWVNDCGTDGGNNLADADPLFIETPDPADAPTSDGNLRLQAGSPAIDAGNNDYVVGVPTDLDGNPRIMGTAVDLGPYENQEVIYTLTRNIVGQGAITADPDATAYAYGTVVTVTAVPDPGWVFLTWSGDLSGSANPATIPMVANKTITATMEQEITGVAAVNSSPTTLGQTTFFTATASGGTNIDYLWSFGDGTDSSGQHASHVYSAAGVYTATLAASNGAGSVQTTTSVTITNQAPIAHAGPDQTTEVNQPVMLDGSASFDPDGHEPLTYGWSQTGGPAVSLSDPTAAQPTFTTPSVGSVLTFTLVVSDSFGLAGDPDGVVVVVQRPAIAIGKTANPTSAGVGDTITYTYSLTNTGDVVLSQINPVDDRLGPLFAEPISLTVGQTVSQLLTYTVAAADLPGPLLNTVVVSGTTPLGSVVTDSDMAVVILSSQPAIHVIKEANLASAGVNEVITYTYTIVNVGDVTLTGITAVDDQLGPISLLTDTLPSLASTSGVLTYTVSESDLPGPLTNMVAVSGTPPVGSQVTATATLSLPLTSSPGLHVEITAVPSLARPGETITFTLSLINSGDVTLYDLGSTVTVPGDFTLPGSLAPGLALTAGYSYTVVSSDLPGPLTNVVTVTATPTANEPVTVTTAVSVTLEPYLIFLPLVVSAPDLID